MIRNLVLDNTKEISLDYRFMRLNIDTSKEIIFEIPYEKINNEYMNSIKESQNIKILINDTKNIDLLNITNVSFRIEELDELIAILNIKYTDIAML